MSTTNEKTPAQEETIALNLKQFAPQAVDPPASAEGEEGMTVIIKRSATKAAHEATRPVVIPKDGGALPPTEMLGAVSYCYAKGIYQSEEIERKMNKDAKLKEATGGEMPDAKAIRRFRKLNRAAIQKTLEKAFQARRRKAKPLTSQKP